MSLKSKKSLGKSSKKSALYIDEEEFERVFEIRVRDLRERKGVKQKSFSISVKKGTKDSDYPDVEELKDKIKKMIKNDS
jgi:hypothetical protein